MVEVSIICLIYKSKKLAKAVYDSAYKYTPKLKNGQAEFLFVANDPTSELADYLKARNYPHIINVNDHLNDKELFKLGYGTPEYMRRVYQGYNQGVLHANGQKIVLINSDNFFSDDWLENLLKYSDYKKVVTSTLVEPGQEHFGVFPFAIQKDFGRTIEEYKEEEFQDFVSKNSKTGYTSGGAYMPCLLYRDVAVMAGLYPEGNIAGKTFDEVKRYGDEYFYDRLKSFGVEHITSKDSVVYHLKEGEKSESQDNTTIIDDTRYKYTGLNIKHKVTPVSLMQYIIPEPRHQEMLDVLGRKFTVIIIHFNNSDELNRQINQIKNQTNKNVEIIVLYDNLNKSSVDRKTKDIEYIKVDRDKKDVVLYKILHRIYGEYVLVPDASCSYDVDMLDKVTEKNTIYYVGHNGDKEGYIVDSVGNFIISKRVFLDDIGVFLGLLLSTIDIEFSADRCTRMNPVVKEEIIDEAVPAPANNSLRYKLRTTIPYRIARKFYHDGPKGIAIAVLSRVKKK